MDENIIINVGRQIGSGGRSIAKMLADEFGCKFYDKELLNLAAKESGFSEKFFEQNDEQKGFFLNRFNIHIPLFGESNFYKNTFSDESLYKFQSDAIRKAADQSSCVFVGARPIMSFAITIMSSISSSRHPWTAASSGFANVLDARGPKPGS